MKKRPSFKPCLQELESRLVPSTVPAPVPSPYALWYSTNWSGVSLDTATHAVKQIQGTWVVSPVAASDTGTGYSSTWIGIDGDISSTVEQLGTESDTATTATNDGTPQYYAWVEMYPAYPLMLNPTQYKVNAGDTISASLTYLGSSSTQYVGHYTTITGSDGMQTLEYTGTTSSNTGRNLNDNFAMTISDSTQGWSFSTNLSLGNHKIAQRNSAEWIEEAPSTSLGALPLSNFGSVTFENAEATIGSATSPKTIASYVGNSAILSYQWALTRRNGWQYVQTTGGPDAINLMNMLDSSGNVQDATSLLGSDGMSFTVQFGSSTPAAPGGAFTFAKKAATDSRIVEVVDTTGSPNQPSSALVVTVVTSSGQVEVLLFVSQPLLTAVPTTTGLGLTGLGDSGPTGTLAPPPVIPNGTNSVAARPAFQNVPSGFDGEAPGANENVFPLPPSEKMQEAPDMPWPSDSRFAAGPHGSVPVPGLSGEANAPLPLPNPGPALTPVGPVASDAELDALFSNWEPSAEAPLASAGPRLDSTDLMLATVAMAGMVVWTQERRQEAEGKQPAFRAP